MFGKLAFVLILATHTVIGSLEAADDLIKAFKKTEVQASLDDPRVGDLPLAGKLFFVLRGWPQVQQWDSQRLFGLLLEKHAHFFRKTGRDIVIPAIWVNNNPGCLEWFQDGTRFRMYALPGAALAISVDETGKYYRVWVYLKSAEDGPQMLIGPDSVRMLQVEPKFSWMEQVSANSISASIQRSANWRSAFVAISGAMATKTATVHSQGHFSGFYGGSSGSGYVSGNYSSYSRVTVPDEEARARASLLTQQIQADALQRSHAVQNTALKKTTVFPGKEISGFVYFKRDKKLRTTVVQVLIGQVSFEFALDRK